MLDVNRPILGQGTTTVPKIPGIIYQTHTAPGLEELFFDFLESFLQPMLCQCSARIWLVIHKNNMEFF